jgi:predicted MFS family arabinose efflux permease
MLSRDFRYLLGAFAVSNLGSKVAREAVQLTAVIVLQATPGELSLMSIAATLPVLVLGLLAGAWLDRRHRRPVMIAADLLRFAIVLSVPIAAWLHVLTMTQLVLVVAGVTTLSLFFDVADQAHLPGFVGRPGLLHANTRREAVDATTEVIGPPIGGVLVQTITAPLTLLIDAISYLLSAALLLRIREPEAPPPMTDGRKRHVWRDIQLGWQALRRQPILLPLLIARGLRTFFGAMLGTFYMLYVIQHLGMTPAGLGMIIACGGVASLLGTFLVRWTAGWLPVGPGIILAFAIKTLGLAMLPAAGLVPAMVVPLLIAQQVLQDGVTSYFAIHERHLRQVLVPPEQLARASATVRVVNDGPVPLGAMLAGLLVPWLGVDDVLWLSVAGYSLSALVALLSPVRRLRSV